MEPTRRQERLAELYRKSASEFFREHIGGEGTIASVTNVEVKDGLREIIVYYSVWPDEKERDIKKAIEAQKGVFRDRISREVRTKFVPEIRFLLDEGEKKRAGIERLLKKATE
ncbi:MAG: ribosome-binding factor A [Patescibacteria group bacterium]